MGFQNTASDRPNPETVSKKKSFFLPMEECFFLTYFLIGEPEAFAKGEAVGMPELIEMLPRKSFRGGQALQRRINTQTARFVGFKSQENGGQSYLMN
jgi:hypothetical protein